MHPKAASIISRSKHNSLFVIQSSALTSVVLNKWVVYTTKIKVHKKKAMSQPIPPFSKEVVVPIIHTIQVARSHRYFSALTDQTTLALNHLTLQHEIAHSTEGGVDTDERARNRISYPSCMSPATHSPNHQPIRWVLLIPAQCLTATVKR